MFYVTARDGRRTAFLLGPFQEHSEALRWVNRARQEACDRDIRAWFYSYGTSRLTKSKSLPNGILNKVVGLYTCDHEGCRKTVESFEGDFCSDHKSSSH